jgi:hypothetical protein
MVDLSEIQTAYYLVAATGVLVAAYYYVYNMRINQKAMKTTLETRQAQFMNQISDELNSIENRRVVLELNAMEWTDWADFEKKYGSTGGNIDSVSRRISLLNKLDNLGWLLKRGLLDPDWVHSQFHATVTPIWLKFEPWVIQMRRVFRSPTIYVGFEYLCRKVMEIEGVMAPEATLPKDVKDFDLSEGD